MARKLLAWKRELEAIMDNPDYIELQISVIERELKRDRPDTGFLRTRVRSIEEWLGEIDLAEKRALKRKKLKKVM